MSKSQTKHLILHRFCLDIIEICTMRNFQMKRLLFLRLSGQKHLELGRILKTLL